MSKEKMEALKPDARRIIEWVIEYSRKTDVHAMDRIATIRGMLLAVLEVEDRK